MPCPPLAYVHSHARWPRFLSAACPLRQVKSFAVRKWLAVSPRGEVRHLELAKMRVTAGLGVQLRDLR